MKKQTTNPSKKRYAQAKYVGPKAIRRPKCSNCGTPLQESDTCKECGWW